MGYVLLALPFAFLAGLVLAVIADVRTGSGYGLGILSSLHLALTTFLVLITVDATIRWAQQLTQPPSLHNGSPLIFLFFYFVFAVYAIGFVMIGAALVAISARHWLWLVGFIVAVLVPVWIGVTLHPLWILNADYNVTGAEYLGILFVPEATVLAYSVTRVIRPVPAARAVTPSSRTSPVSR